MEYVLLAVFAVVGTLLSLVVTGGVAVLAGCVLMAASAVFSGLIVWVSMAYGWACGAKKAVGMPPVNAPSVDFANLMRGFSDDGHIPSELGEEEDHDVRTNVYQFGDEIEEALKRDDFNPKTGRSQL